MEDRLLDYAMQESFVRTIIHISAKYEIMKGVETGQLYNEP